MSQPGCLLRSPSPYLSSRPQALRPSRRLSLQLGTPKLSGQPRRCEPSEEPTLLWEFGAKTSGFAPAADEACCAWGSNPKSRTYCLHPLLEKKTQPVFVQLGRTARAASEGLLETGGVPCCSLLEGPNRVSVFTVRLLWFGSQRHHRRTDRITSLPLSTFLGPCTAL